MKKRTILVSVAALLLGMALIFIGCGGVDDDEDDNLLGSSDKLYLLGIGVAANYRATQHISINDVAVVGLFDDEGKVVALYCDMVEVDQGDTSPNTDGAAFAGWPGQRDDGTTFLDQIASWMTKRDRGTTYAMTNAVVSGGPTHTWAQEMNRYQDFFVGKTVAELKKWKEDYTAANNGQPLRSNMTGDNLAKYNALTKAEQDALNALTAHTDTVSGATMSLTDPHGFILTAIEKAYNDRVPINVNRADIKSIALGQAHNGRTMGAVAATGRNAVYTLNSVFAGVVLGTNDKILASRVDILEVSSPNYDGEDETMPHFAGWDAQGVIQSYNHTTKVFENVSPTADLVDEYVKLWVTKRERGPYYQMTTGTWASQMDRFEKLFKGKTPAEVAACVAKYTDTNGRPLKDTVTGDNKTKYDGLSASDKAMLADVVASATMSLNDPHGDIVKALEETVKAGHRNSVK